jgi:NAD+ synthase (glutamine-hydrolysing)
METSKSITLSTVSINSIALDFEGNFALHKEVLESKETEKSKIILFPELSLSGYGCEDGFYFPWVWDACIKSLGKLLPLTKDRLVVVGLPLFQSPYLYNTCAIISNGKIRGLVAKRNLANTGIHYEKRWFTEWSQNQEPIRINSIFPESFTEADIYLGDTIFDWDGCKIALEICEDSWVVHRPSHEYSELGASVILCPGASHFAFGKYETRSRIFQESSRTQGNVFAFANLIGNESGRAIFDGGNLIFQSGKIIGIGKILPLTDICISTATFNIQSIANDRAKFYRRSTAKQFSKKMISIPSSPFQNEIVSSPIQRLPNENNFQSFSSALILGLFDYLRKSGMKGYTLSLSGGADSSALAILVAAMESEVKKERGDTAFSELGIDSPLLTTIYQKTENNSSTTQEIAANLAKEVGAEHHNISIDSTVDSMVDLISRTIKRKLNWKQDGIALQNIQARGRSPLVWLLANTKNQLLLSTGNRSESSVGYTTMDGDSSGSICPIAGVSKKFLLDWLHFINKSGDSRIPTYKSLADLLHTKPSAELKPLDEEQEDEKDLMPYAILQDIENAFVNHGLNKSEILGQLVQKWDSYSSNELKTMLERYLYLFRISQWKRERFAVSFHLDEYGLDPKTSFRFPVLSGRWDKSF